MKKLKKVEFASLMDLLDNLEANPDKYESRMLDENTVLIGDIYIRRYFNIDPENPSEQYDVFAGDNEYKILPGGKIWFKKINNIDTSFKIMDYPRRKANHMWYQTANIHQKVINENFIKFHNRQPRREFILILTTSILASLVTSGVNIFMNKKQNNVQTKKEIPVEIIKKPVNPADTIMYNEVRQNVK